MKILMVSLAVVIGSLVLVAVTGYSLTAERAGYAERTIAAPRTDIIAAMVDVERQTEWRRDVSSIERVGDIWVETTSSGEHITFQWSGRWDDSLALRFKSDRGYAGEWRAKFSNVVGGTRVSVEEWAIHQEPALAGYRTPDVRSGGILQTISRRARDICGGEAVNKTKNGTDWYKRFNAAKEPHVVILPSDFAGVRAGSTMLISSPAQIANYVSAIPHGEIRTVARMRRDLAKRAKVDAMCPVTTAIFLKIVAEVALRDISDGKAVDEVAPFWRIVTPDTKIAAKLSCGPDGVDNRQRLDAGNVTHGMIRVPRSD